MEGLSYGKRKFKFTDRCKKCYNIAIHYCKKESLYLEVAYNKGSRGYFGLGKISKDQVVNYAERKGKTLDEMEKWLAPNLNYK